MIKVTFELNGSPVEPGQLGNAFQDAVLESVRDHITDTLSSVRCPVHGSQPSIVASGNSLETLTFTVSGCCDELISTTQAALG